MTVHAPRFLNRTGIKVVNLTPVSPVLRCRAAAPACWISFMLPLFPCAQLAADSAGSQLTGPLLPARFAPLDVDALLAQLPPLKGELHNALLLGGKKLRPQGRQIPQGQYDYGFLDVWRGCLDPLPDRLHDFGRCQRRLHLREYQVFNLSGGQHPHRACARAKAPIPRRDVIAIPLAARFSRKGRLHLLAVRCKQQSTQDGFGLTARSARRTQSFIVFSQNGLHFLHKGFGTMAACWPGYATPLCTISPRYKCDERTAGLKSCNRLVRQCRRCADCRGGRSATTGDGSIRSCWRITGSARADSFTPLACAMPHVCARSHNRRGASRGTFQQKTPRLQRASKAG